MERQGYLEKRALKCSFRGEVNTHLGKRREAVEG